MCEVINLVAYRQVKWTKRRIEEWMQSGENNVQQRVKMLQEYMESQKKNMRVKI